MQSFRTELENPLVEKDIIELEKKIREFRQGEVPEEKFRSLRLARGIYGQRQQGVQMVRIKLPYGKMTFAQWKRIADVSDEFSNGNLHLTTRQDIQIHFVSLNRTPELWGLLAEDDITIREACGNTVRNVTASDIAGIDIDEPFDVTPYAHAVFEYLLRKPFCQEMGRKFKIAFSSSEKDTALVFMHDLGAIPRIKEINGQQIRGFKVVIGGGLGAQPHLAITAHEFLEEDFLLPYIEAVLRVFDRYGERSSRHKARMKFLLQQIGIEKFTELVKDEQKAVAEKIIKIDTDRFELVDLPNGILPGTKIQIKNKLNFEAWKKTNVRKQKQEGYYIVYVRVPNGNISSGASRRLIEKLRPVIANDIRVTISQNLQFRFVKEEHLEYIYSLLESENFAAAGIDSAADIVSCPGTDTCNLGISNSTELALVLARVIEDEFPEFLQRDDIAIRISGCMNSCGQHGIGTIGFHGSSMKVNGKVLPAVQVLIGGGKLGGGEGRISNKVIKLPSKRGPEILRYLLNDFLANKNENQNYLDYTFEKGERYFYDLLKPLADATTLADEDFIDWGHEEKFATAIGVGECAGVMIDLVATLILEADEKLSLAEENIQNNVWSDGIYQAYASFIHAAKALLLNHSVQCNTQTGILKDFDIHFTEKGLYNGSASFKEMVLQINQNEPSQEFAVEYLEQAKAFNTYAHAFREQLVNN
ncbi:MAG: HEPN domain-containing protein [Bacteroidetes bacterium]|nr:HEPN domain-containing protein [Bacteroidota bacterium]MBS1974056.1 HEPN domain-containing protein [Bacteroidota bacterium]